MLTEVIYSEEPEFDPCPMGCGRITDDPYGGPCSECWKDVLI